MKKIILAMAAISAVSVAVPAAAARNGIEMRSDQLQHRIQRGVQNRTISQREAVPLRAELRQLNRSERRFSRNGLSRSERYQLRQQVQVLEQRIHFAERNRSFRTGQRFSGGQYNNVPVQYRERYRDDDRYSYRYDDDGRIYQIDRRNDLILRIIEGM